MLYSVDPFKSAMHDMIYLMPKREISDGKWEKFGVILVKYLVPEREIFRAESVMFGC